MSGLPLIGKVAPVAAEVDVSDGETSAIPMEEEVELKFGVSLQIRLKPPPTTVPLVIKSDEQAKVPVVMSHAESSKDGDRTPGVPVLTPIVCDPADCDVLLGGRIRWRGDSNLIGCDDQETLELPRVVKIMTGEQS
jgi:hypothetical protein